MRTSIRILKTIGQEHLSGDPAFAYDGGRSTIFVPGRSALARQLGRYGVEDPEFAIVTNLISAGMTVLDVGANLGLFALLAAQRVGPTGHVIAIEPSVRASGLLRRSIDASHFHWVTVRQCAIADCVGEAEFLELSGDSAGLSHLATHANETRTVEVTTLDKLVSSLNLTSIDFVKIDIEGAEVLALTGATTVLNHHRPAMYIEVEPSHLARQQTSAADLRRILEGYGYIAFSLGAGSKRDGFRRHDWDAEHATPNVLFVVPASARKLGLTV